MRSQMLIGLGVAVVVAIASAYAADEVKLEGVKCVVAAKNDAKAANAVDYRGGQVYFCCMNCPKTLAAEAAKYATKANYQLVATKQARQEKCPFTGKDIDPAETIKVGTVDVSFCCGDCKAKAEGEKDQVEAIFNDQAFDKGFKVAKKE